MPHLVYYAFDFISRHISFSTRQRIGRSKLLKPLRDRLLRDGDRPLIASAEVEFEGLRFMFTAPYSGLSHAKKGIEQRICRALRSSIRPGSVCVDVGASFGYVSLVMATAGGVVHSFEPSPFTYRTLVETIRKNGLEGELTAHHIALGDHEGVIDITQFGESEQVKLMTLDSFVAKHGIGRVDVLKVDVDGLDLEVLKGARNTLKCFHPVLVVEMTDRQQEIHDLLKSVGYTCLSDTDGTPLRLHEWPANLLAYA